MQKQGNKTIKIALPVRREEMKSSEITCKLTEIVYADPLGKPGLAWPGLAWP